MSSIRPIRPNKLARILKFGAAASFAALALTGCITVEVPASIETAESTTPRPSGTTFTATPRETVTAEEVEAAPEQTQESSETFVSQAVDFSISGGCQNSYEAVGYYGIFEEFEDDCYLIVEVFPPSPRRYAELQYFDESWEMESSGYTDSEGILYLEVDNYCEDGYWCDGKWDYRVSVEADGALQAERSVTFELEFIPWE